MSLFLFLTFACTAGHVSTSSESEASDTASTSDTSDSDLSLAVVGEIPGISGIRMSGYESEAAVLDDANDIVTIVDLNNIAVDRIVPIPEGKSLDVVVGSDGLVLVPFEVLGIDEDGGVAIFRGVEMIGWVPCTHAHHIVYSDEDEFLYITSEHSFEVWDIADPVSPVRLGSWTGEGTRPHGLVLRGDNLFAGAWAGLGIYDVANPEDPIQIGWGVSMTRVHSVAVVGETAYTTDESQDGGWLRAWDISNPEMPLEFAQLHANAHADIYPMAVLGNRMYLAASEDGLLAFDKDGGSIPEGGYSCECSASGVKLVAAGQDRIAILRGNELVVLKQE